MRFFLATLAVFGLLAIGLAVSFATGLLQLPQPRAVSGAGTAIPITNAPAVSGESGGPATRSAGDDSDWTGPPDPVLPDPSAMDRAIVLAADEAKLSGRRVRLYTSDGREERGDREEGMGRQRAQARRLRGRAEEAAAPSVIRGWAEPQDVAEWDLAVPQGGRYSVVLVYSSGGGGKFELTAGDETIEARTESTGRGYRMIEAGKVTLAAGETKLRLRPADKLDDPRMTLRSIKLYPVP